jgi:predicted MFS family arabinose efflux permease
LGSRAGAALPERIRSRIQTNSLDNAHRFERLNRSLAAIVQCFTARGIDFCVLKGFTHSPDFTPDPLLRAQGDIDLWHLPAQVDIALQALLDLGYRPSGKSKGRHLDPMIHDLDRQFEWRGDYFARDLAIPVDLHFELWDQNFEFITAPDEQACWQRRVAVPFADSIINRLAPCDALTFAVLHFMMHLFHGDPRLQRAWEIAHFLHNRSRDEEFWRRWEKTCSPRMLHLQVAAFELSRLWFGGNFPPCVASLVDNLPSAVSLWLRRYGFSPIESLFVPNKDELWLNLSFVDSYRNKGRVFFRRLLPTPHVPPAQPGEAAARSRFVWGRMQHHLRTFHTTCLRGFEWHWTRLLPTAGFLRFLLVSVLFDFGEFIFFLLYNLYLVERGFDETFIGHAASAFTAGSLVGVLPGSEIARCYGLRNLVMLAVIGTAIAATFRTLAFSPAVLLASAFMNGLFLSLWAVAMPPAVAGLTSVKNRTLGFSVISSVGIGSGAVAGLIGGHLPGALLSLYPAFSSIRAKQIALLIGSALAALAIVPGMSLPLPPSSEQKRENRIYPNSSFIRIFLVALFAWMLGTLGFNAFFNVYFARHLHATVPQIGLISSYSQLVQVGAILLAPVWLSRTGTVRGIAGAQFAAAAMLALLAIVRGSAIATPIYAAYMAFQYMCEPCMLSMLMTNVAPHEQGGASALNFLVTSLAGILAASAVGAGITHAGYRSTLLACAFVATFAAFLFGLLFKGKKIKN